MIPLATSALSVLSKVPPIVYVLLALGGWGAYQKHQATVKGEELREQQAKQAQAEAEGLKKSLEETSRRLEAQKGVTHRANQKATKALAAAASSASALERMSLAASAAALRANANNTSPARPSEADLLANALSRCGAEYQRVAAIADTAIVAGQACEEAYNSLTPGDAAAAAAAATNALPSR